jgi:hypothetical protein
MHVVACNRQNQANKGTMKKFVLYVKTHLKTGLKYLGQTSNEDPHKYTGSGKYWLRHIKSHGKVWQTEILHESQYKKEIDSLGEYYSQLWNVVESKQWANLKPESGDGAASGFHNPMKNPKILAKQKSIINDPKTKEKHRLATIKAMNNPLVKEKLKKQRNTPEYRERLKHTLHRPRDRSGEKNSNHNTTLYKFKHITGEILVCTQYELTKRYNLTSGAASRLINGKYKITKGWMLDQ